MLTETAPAESLQAIAAKAKKGSPRSVKEPEIVAVISQAVQADLAASRYAPSCESRAPAFFPPKNMLAKNKPNSAAPTIPRLAMTASGKLDVRILPLPAPKPNVSMKT